MKPKSRLHVAAWKVRTGPASEMRSLTSLGYDDLLDGADRCIHDAAVRRALAEALPPGGTLLASELNAALRKAET